MVVVLLLLVPVNTVGAGFGGVVADFVSGFDLILDGLTLFIISARYCEEVSGTIGKLVFLVLMTVIAGFPFDFILGMENSKV